MIRIRFAIATAVLALVGSVSGQPIVEQFGYSAGALTTVGSPTWINHSAAGTNPQQVLATSLSYPGMSGITGGSVQFTTNGEDNGRGGFAVTTASLTTVYFSAVTSLSLTTATGDYFTHLIDGLQTSGAFRGRVFAKTNGGAYNLGIRYGTNDGPVYDTTDSLALNTPVFFVVKLTSVPGVTNDTASMWVNPPLGGSEPAPTVTTTQTDVGQDWGNIDFVAIRQGAAASGAAGVIDSIRVGTTWAQVTNANAGSSRIDGWKKY